MYEGIVLLNFATQASGSIVLKTLSSEPELPAEMSFREDSFTAIYKGVQSRLVTEVELFGTDDRKLTARALWDTGSTHSGIAVNIAEKLKLAVKEKESRVYAYAPDQVVETNHYFVGIKIPRILDDPIHEVIGYNFLDVQGIDVLIGMDIISKGRFLLEVKDGNTHMEFTATD